MALPTMRVPSTGNTIALDILPAANSGKSMDEWLNNGDANPTFRGLSASDFTSRVAGWQITEGDGSMDYSNYDEGDYSRNVTSLYWEVLTDPSALTSSGDSGYKPNLRDRSILFAPSRYISPVTVKPERPIEAAISSSLVKLHLVSLGGNLRKLLQLV